MSIFDQIFSDDPQQAAKLALAAGLLGGRGSFGGILGKSLMDAQGIYGSVADSNLKNQYTKLQIDEAKRKAKQQERDIADQERFRESLVAQGSPQIRSVQAALSGGGGPTPENAARISPVDPVQQLMFNALENRQLTPMQYLQTLQKDRPKLTKIEPMRSNGVMVNVAFFEDGSHKVLPYGVKPDVALQNLGNRVVGIDKNEASGQSYGIGMTPDALLSASTQRRGQDLVDARSREANAINKEAARVQIVNDPVQGPILIDKGTKKAEPARFSTGERVPGETAAKASANANDVSMLINKAEALIDDATGSYLGAGIDEAGRVFGGATSGAIAIGRLKAIEGSLLAKMPRMEGPQSNYDVQNYREAAGQIGSSTVPREVKKAALQTIKEIQARYAQDPGGTKSLPPQLPLTTPGGWGPVQRVP